MRTPSLMKSFGLAAALTVAGCATDGLYHPAEYPGGEGFSETLISPDRYRVSFQGDMDASRATVEDYLLLRAAELAMEQGRAGFRMTEVDTDALTRVHHRSHDPARPAVQGRYAHARRPRDASGFPFYAWGYTWGVPPGRELYETTRYVAVAYVTLLDAADTARTPDAFDAATVMATVGPVSCYKSEPHDEANCPLAHDHD